MARYIGPSTKIARKFREPIFGPDKSFEKKNYPPGQHGVSKKRNKQSEYAVQLMEKQKVKYMYGILERQFAKIFDRALRKQGITGENLLQLIESRLDNVVFRLGPHRVVELVPRVEGRTYPKWRSFGFGVSRIPDRAHPPDGRGIR